MRSIFFQAEDGIRDDLVTGVQTCALPISWSSNSTIELAALLSNNPDRLSQAANSMVELLDQVISQVCEGTDLAAYLKAKYRSEERRVGKECRSRGTTGMVREHKSTRGNEV